jgi:hypothetical protein
MNNKITSPLSPRQTGRDVANLHSGLQLLLERAALLAHDEPERRLLAARLRGEVDEQSYGEITQQLVRAAQVELRLDPTGTVDRPTAVALNRWLAELSGEPDQGEYLVRGTLTDADGEPVADITVWAFDRDLRREQPLWRQKTDRVGSYLIRYSSEQFRRAEKDTADLVLRGFAGDGSLLAESPVLFNAPEVARIDLKISPAKTPPLFGRIQRELKPLLDGLTPRQLDQNKEHQDLTFLAGETRIDINALARFALAHRLAREELPPEFWFALLGPPFFAFDSRPLKEQFASVVAALPSLDGDAVRKALESAITRRDIAESFRESIPAWVEAFLSTVAHRMVQGDHPTFARQALEDAGIKDERRQLAFARLLVQHKTMTPALIEALEKDHGFDQSEIADLSVSFTLSDLTRGDFSVVKMIKDKYQVRQPEQVRLLAKRSESEWVELVRAQHEAGTVNLPGMPPTLVKNQNLPVAEVYGAQLARRFREAFPTTAFAGGLERALHTGTVAGIPRPELIGRFLVRNESFDLLHTPVDEYLDKYAHTDSRALARDDSFRREVKSIQRVFKLAPTFEAADALLSDGLHSAQAVYRLGKSEFVRRFRDRAGFTEESAQRAWNRAADTHAAVLTIVADLKARQSESMPLAMKQDDSALASFPNWNNLFQTGDLCDCDSCRSVLSPAAYFADLLMFLKYRKTTDGDSVKDLLFRRRPDLGFLELNCDNALVPLPYVDVVCEVLEAAVAAGKDAVELVGFTAMPADPATARAKVVEALAAKGLSLGATFSLSRVKPADDTRWVAHGDEATFLLQKIAPATDFSAWVLPNTKASAEELRARPQYVSTTAYETLRGQKYPLGLPFDLFAEEVRSSLAKVNVARWEMMRVLGGKAPNNPTEGEIACEYFAISKAASGIDEKSLILVADATDAGQQVVWGESGSNWLNAVGNVSGFFRKTSLEYNDLLGLLDLPFLNPTGDIAIVHLDPTCDTDQKVLQVLDAPKLDRFHRFLRLWRKLPGWKSWELDLVLGHPAIGNKSLDESFLIKLFYFCRLRERLGGKVSVEQLCSLFDKLNTASHFTRAFEQRADSLYTGLFLNKRVYQPLVDAFAVAKVTANPATITATISDATNRPVILAALRLSESDLTTFVGLKKTNGSAYIDDKLSLDNLSFLWRHSWLAKLLGVKPQEWPILLKLLGVDVPQFATPQDAWGFVAKVDLIRATGFGLDELDWVLLADRDAKSASKEADVARFLVALRKDLHAIRDEYDAGQYAFLSTPEVNALTALLLVLLGKLNRDEAAAQFFLDTLNDVVKQQASVALPTGFTFPTSITGPPNNIPISYETTLTFGGIMTAAQRTVLETDPSLAAVTGLTSYKDAIKKLFENPGQPAAADLPTGFVFPAAITGAPNKIPIRYDTTLRYTGVMTDAQLTTLTTDPSLAAINGIAAYKSAVEEFHRQPRLALKFYDPVFTSKLAALPDSVDFSALTDAALARKISYDSERRELRFVGIMTSGEKSLLDALSTDLAYRNAVNDLATQPNSIPATDPRVWLSDPTFPLKDNLPVNLVKAVERALGYLSRTLSESAIILQGSSALGLTEALTDYLLTNSPLISGKTLLVHLRDDFAVTDGVVDYATLPATFDGWFWSIRVASLLLKWKINLNESKTFADLVAKAKVLDLKKLPLKSAGTAAAIDDVLRTNRLVRLRDTLPETKITFLEVLVKLTGTMAYPKAAFGDDAALLNDSWAATDAVSFTDSLGLTYPADFLLAENWERLVRAFALIGKLGAGAATATPFAAASMTPDDPPRLARLLRARFGSETWLTLSGEIQDILRERKRDALAAYLLTQKMPDDAPTGKWENPDDLYAYYLLDVEMGCCMLTSRLVQASGSIQLLVQRCMMALEPKVKVVAGGDEGDSAWTWWTWMSKYRVWEANRQVFLWPENWIEPELKPDRSPFFKEMENDLLQNEITQDSVETAFTSYLEKLDGVARLEVAGFFHEDDGDNAIVHVFGRTPRAEPHLYYYRRYDYRQWTPWEKVDLDIQGDYLRSAVVANRLLLFWPVFTEVGDEQGNTQVTVPKADTGAAQPDVTLPRTMKKLRMQMAVSDYRQGKWTPRRLSVDFDETSPYKSTIVKKYYEFLLVDRSDIDGRVGVKYEGYSAGNPDDYETYTADLYGAFELGGCKGLPERADLRGYFQCVPRPDTDAVGGHPEYMKWVELSTHKTEDFTLVNTTYGFPDKIPSLTVLQYTPGQFIMTPAWHLSWFDRIYLDGLVGEHRDNSDAYDVPVGTWLPYFYDDKKRTFFVLPTVFQPGEYRILDLAGGIRYYYPDLKRLFRTQEDEREKVVKALVDGIDYPHMPPAARQQAENEFHKEFPEEPPPPYTDQQIIALAIRSLMRFVHETLARDAVDLLARQQFHFKNNYHPFACDFAKLVYNPLKGIPALMSRDTQFLDTGFNFRQSYQPTASVAAPPVRPTEVDAYPHEVVDFSPDGAYSPYNWELFFHAPLMIANALSRNQQFAEAREWYHFIFNPLGVESSMPGGSPQSKYWITKPFFLTTSDQYLQQRIDSILRLLAGDPTAPGYSDAARHELEAQVRDWRDHPFEPHRIANYRTVAYQKTVVMKYLDNLIAWGDNLFRQDSMESINEATQLYILAAEILGPRPRQIPPRARPTDESFNELEDSLDKFSEALVEVENVVPPQPGGGGGDTAPLPTLYFCIPHNDKMLGYWDTVADRLYKIRHCMNIDGVVRQLSLFEPPIDPGAMVKAIAGGLDLGAALAERNAPLPLYRFGTLLQKANEVCNDVKSLGAALLSALEKKDAEELAQLRQGQEVQVLAAVTAVKQKQIDEAQDALDAAKKGKEVTTIRRDYYRDIQKTIPSEDLHQEKLYAALTAQQVAQGINIAASAAHIVPSFDIGANGFGGTPYVAVMFGGPNVGAGLQAAAGAATFLANIENYNANKASINASQERRWDDWKFQERLADKELEQLDESIAAAQDRLDSAKKDLENHIGLIDNARAVDAFLRSKYTSKDLYQWQLGQISSVYFQSYRLAYDLAKRAERCFRFELGLADSSYINFGYWDSLKKGLLSGEKLQYDLRRLESAYLEQNRREFELTKHVSLALLKPLALVQLRETGRCDFDLPEEIFDLDYPGHYFRRIKSVSLTLPCVAGPYTTIACTARLLKNSIRINTTSGDNGYPRNTQEDGTPADDTRFVESNIPCKAIASSSAQNDSGVFELSFRDERYLPFEGAGVVSKWALELFNDPADKQNFARDLRQFDYSTITDAVLHVRYTAREDVGPFRSTAIAHLRERFQQDGSKASYRLLDLRREFPTPWHRFLYPTKAGDTNILELEVSHRLFRPIDSGKTLQVTGLWMLARCTDAGAYKVVLTPVLEPPAGPPDPIEMNLPKLDKYGGLHAIEGKDVASATGFTLNPTDPLKWKLNMTRPGGGPLKLDDTTKRMEVEDLILVLGYEWV